MCQFFSFVHTQTNEIFYFNREQRLELQKTNPDDNPDSHAFICVYYKINEDRVNKYEYQTELIEDDIVFEPTSEHLSNINFFVENINLMGLVTNSSQAYQYCKYIKDDPDVRKYITNSEHALYYCLNIKNDPDVRKFITDSYHAYEYCLNVYEYCLNVYDDPEVSTRITNPFFVKMYAENILKNKKHIN